MTKNSQSTFFRIIKLCCLVLNLTQAAYHHKIEPFSFDLKKFEYPLEYHKWGTAIALRKTIKVLPKVENRYGGLWLSQVGFSAFHYLKKSNFLTHFLYYCSPSKQTCSKYKCA